MVRVWVEMDFFYLYRLLEIIVFFGKWGVSYGKWVWGFGRIFISESFLMCFGLKYDFFSFSFWGGY